MRGMQISKIVKAFYNFGIVSKRKSESLQRNIRIVEWNAIENFIPRGSVFLDIGCGGGFSMQLAKERRNCTVFGIDPEPLLYGVQGAFSVQPPENFNANSIIIEGNGELLPYDANTFDVVYSSHVLEHVADQDAFLSQAERVLNTEGVFILGVPTATMACINLFSQLALTSHRRLIKFLISILQPGQHRLTKLSHLFFGYSHSFHRKTVLYDIKHYKIKRWEQIIEKHFDIFQIVKPALYPYPDFYQFFRLQKGGRYSSSVFFICKAKRYS
jgi:ubiquinone/menaquinone biosynthesis C-methylase UbiE